MTIPTDQITGTAGTSTGLPSDDSQEPSSPPLTIEVTLVPQDRGILSEFIHWLSKDVFLAILLWLFSLIAILVLPVLVAFPYIVTHYKGATNLAQSLATDPTILLLSVIGVIPAHLLTLGAAWMIVTRRGTRPFWRTLGWYLGSGVEFVSYAGLAIALWFLGVVLTRLIGGEPTDIDILANSALPVRLLLAIVATTSGPLVEEVVYRGIIYPALEERVGMAWSVTFVSFLFVIVHVYQYRNNAGVIAVIVLLSVTLTLVRAFTGRLLPCVIIHVVFNGIVSVIIVFQPYFAQLYKGSQPKTSLVTLWRMTRLFT